MEQTSLFFEGVNLMVLGMGFVFIFLVFLIFATNLMSKSVTRFAPLPIVPVKKSKSKPTTKTALQDEQLLAVLSAAIHHHQIQQQTNS